jgi:hypothetical protein
MKLINSPISLFWVWLAVLLLAVEAGYRRGLQTDTAKDDRRHDQIVDTRNQIAVLLSLLLGFMLAMSLPRYDQRKQLVVDEANAIGTTTLRAQMLPDAQRMRSKQLLEEYAQSRIDFAEAGVDDGRLQAALTHARQVQAELWQQAVTASQQAPTPITALFVQAVNETIDLDEKRLAALENRIPAAVWIMLGLIALLTCVTVGYSQRQRIFLSMIVPPLMIAIVVALIADLDTPRSGLILVGQQSMQRVQTDFKAGESVK